MLHSQVIEKINVQWKDSGPNEATWEMEDQMMVSYLFFLDK